MNEKNGLVFIVDDDRHTRRKPEQSHSLGRIERANIFISPGVFGGRASEEALVAWCSMCSLPGLSGLDLQQELAKASVKIPIIFITGHGDIPTSRAGHKGGGSWSFSPNPLTVRICCVRSSRRLRAIISHDSQTETPARATLTRSSAKVRL